MGSQLSDEATKKMRSLGVLPYSPEKAAEIYRMPQNEPGWFEEWRIRWTASSIASAVGLSKRGDSSTALAPIMNNITQTASMKRCIELEPVIAENYRCHLQV